jgi:hypothetical protein
MFLLCFLLQGKHMKSVSDSILRRIRAKQRGWVFTPKDFIDIAPRNNIGTTLHRLLKKGIIRKVGHGLYDYPYQHPKLGTLSPSQDGIVHAVASKSGDVIQPSGAMLANMLGLDLQVPAKISYLTSGKTEQKKVGNHSLKMRHSRFLSGAQLNPNVVRVISAIHYLGKRNITDAITRQCKRILTNKDKSQLRKNLARLPDWMIPFALKITGK